MNKQAISDPAVFRQHAAAILADAGFRVVDPPALRAQDDADSNTTGFKYIVRRVRSVLTATC